MATGQSVRIIAPLADMDKRRTLIEAAAAGLPLGLTFSCVRPVDRQHCGRCNKCAERRRAFAAIGRPDPTRYAHA